MIDMTRHQLNFRVGADLLDRLKLISESQNLSVSAYCVRAIEFCLDSQISFIPSGDRSQSPPIDMDILGSVRECQKVNNQAIESRLAEIEARLATVETRLDSQLDNDSVVSSTVPVAVEDEIRKLRTVDKLSFAKMYKVLNASGYRLPNGNKFRSEDVSAIADRLGLPPIK